MRAIILGFASSLSMSEGQAGGDYVTGNTFMEWCGDPQSGKALALGYVAGLIEGTELFNRPQQPFQCISTPVTPAQIKDLSCNYMRDHPEIRHKGAGGTISALWRTGARAW